MKLTESIFVEFWVGLWFGAANGELNCSSLMIPYQDKIGDALKTNKTLFLEPALEKCFNSNPYEIHQLPFEIGQEIRKFNIAYEFTLGEVSKVESDGSVQIVATFTFYWTDHYRKWRKSEVPLEYIHIPANEVWTPKFHLENCESRFCYVGPDNETVVEIEHHGKASYSVCKLLDVKCHFSVKYFPFDQQLCELYFIYLGQKIQILPMRNTRRMFDIISEEWEVFSVKDSPRNFTTKEFKKTKEGHRIPPHGESVAETGFAVYITMKRYVNYYVYTLLCPVIVMAALGFFTIFLQPNSDAKINMAVTVLLGFILIQTIIASLFPKLAEVPFLAYYTLFALILSAINLAGSLIVTGIYHISDDVEMPKYLFLMLVFFNLICCNRLSVAKVTHETRKELEETNKNCPTDQECLNETGHHQGKANSRKHWQHLASFLNKIFSFCYLLGNVFIIIAFFLPMIWQEALEISHLGNFQVFDEEAHSHD